MSKAKQRQGRKTPHNEYFQPVVRKACPCGSNSKRGGTKHQVFGWGEYVRATYRTIDYFCEVCFQTRVVPRLTRHAKECGCEFNLMVRSGHSIPQWIRMPMVCDTTVVAALMSSPWEQGWQAAQGAA